MAELAELPEAEVAETTATAAKEGETAVRVRLRSAIPWPAVPRVPLAAGAVPALPAHRPAPTRNGVSRRGRRALLDLQALDTGGAARRRVFLFRGYRRHRSLGGLNAFDTNALRELDVGPLLDRPWTPLFFEVTPVPEVRRTHAPARAVAGADARVAGSSGTAAVSTTAALAAPPSPSSTATATHTADQRAEYPGFNIDSSPQWSSDLLPVQP